MEEEPILEITALLDGTGRIVISRPAWSTYYADEDDIDRLVNDLRMALARSLRAVAREPHEPIRAETAGV